ncbi:class I SAM-dependent methyltransferase [Ottowia testudinis]|uniref:Methyltransferase domain-containing protein n=1 Tax=Ottowia testudinis TaxID=2816950 RepID=A0A975CHC8_9BURK|nr:methyltransferase domain-containing protein [Ottowia testudinis]QTD44204.1 methyltransferase domain-containing protein [Ottowia testudinis]
MTRLHDWFQTAPGQYVLAWERAQFDTALADVFGYHALQVGLAGIDALAANRMPHRWLAMAGSPGMSPQELAALSHQPVAAEGEPAPQTRLALVTDSTALPFAEASLDLVVLPHTLELSADPHATLREVQRVLVHEGRVAIAGLNPASLWGLRQYRAHLLRGAGQGQLYLPDAGEFIGHWRLRDWLRLLQFELESLSFGCYAPAVRSARSLARFGWMDRAGPRWWPIFGAAYVMVAVKRSHGAKLVGATWKTAPVPANAPVSIAGRATLASAGTEKDHESS